ncbi:hypothetical protein SAMN02745975_03685 [Geosporobacter subterraneus DSM 17957]|uniref:Uncharacterized protein n=1 Tax=Geosporobacter subterraneus DSM 17957 TaxID=1121919 RepID=A0A1M6PUL1_9FIRM|nr:hypothetical protein [Geosporobacter subterraneus]SHK11684.1 hypothetical protein SAMN02745975_03685 [Geosporobacter subterraneus DSM 17957]
MESQEIVWKFFMKQKSVVTSVENFLDDFIEIYEKSKKREQEVLSECIQQMFRKYYYSTLMPDTYLECIRFAGHVERLL